nr:Ldh family oxidoreductase [Pseudorhodoplanes sinuspersici]
MHRRPRRRRPTNDGPGAAFLTNVQAWDKNPGIVQNLGHVFILIDTSMLGALSWLHARMEEFLSILHDTPAADPENPVVTPDEREMKAYARSSRDGVAVSKVDFENIGCIGLTILAKVNMGGACVVTNLKAWPFPLSSRTMRAMVGQTGFTEQCLHLCGHGASARLAMTCSIILL